MPSHAFLCTHRGCNTKRKSALAIKMSRPCSCPCMHPSPEFSIRAGQMAYLFQVLSLTQTPSHPYTVFAFVLSFFRIFNPDLLTPALFIDPIRPTPSCLSDNGALLTDGSNSFEKGLFRV